MRTVKIDSEDAVWISGDLYCKTPEALEITLETLRGIGYEIQNNRTDGAAIQRGGNEVDVKLMEENGWSLWFAKLDIRTGKCGSCHEYISERGIRVHGHKCEKCGAVTYREIARGSTVTFKFREHDGLFDPEVTMEAYSWNAKTGYLYLNPEPRERGGLFTLGCAEAKEYLEAHADAWDLINYFGRPAIRIRYRNYPHKRDNPIEMKDVWGHQSNHKIVSIWDDKEYGEHGFDLPVPDMISIYETWHWAPLEPSPTLHERLIGVVGQVARADYYYQDGRPAWDRSVYTRMGEFIRHFTTLDAGLWDRVSRRFPLDGPGGIAAVAAFCHPDSVVLNEPNIGNLLTAVTGLDRSPANLRAALAAVINDPETQGFAMDIFGRLI